MKFLVVVSCLALACGAQASGWVGPPANIALSQDGRNILDTPEVAQARAAHLSALQRASQNNPNPHDDGSYNPQWDNEEYWQRAEQPRSWNGAPAQQWNAPAQNQWSAPAHNQWNAAPAAPAWNAAGAAPAPVAETPEVAQARAAHLAALSAAKSSAPANQWNDGQWNNNNNDGQWNNNDGQWNNGAHNQWNAAPAQNQWNGAPSWQAGNHQAAQIRLAHDGSGILDTPEVAAARAAHLAAHAQAGHGAPAPQNHW